MGKAGLGAACSSLRKNFSCRRSPVKTVLLSTGKSCFIILFFGQKWPNAWKREHFAFEVSWFQLGLNHDIQCFRRFVFRCLLFWCPLSPTPVEWSTAHPASPRDWQEMPQPCFGAGVFALNLPFFPPPISLLALLRSLHPSCSGSLRHCQPLSLLSEVNSGTSTADAECSFLKGSCDWGTGPYFV